MGLIIIPGQECVDQPEEMPPCELTRQRLQQWVMDAHLQYDEAQYGGGPPSDVDKAIYQAIKMCVTEGDPKIAVLILMGLFADKYGPSGTLSELLEEMARSLEGDGLVLRECRVCGCTNAQGCVRGCFWIDWDLCSGCVGPDAQSAALRMAERTKEVLEGLDDVV